MHSGLGSFMQDNTKRGLRTLFWMKAVLVTAALAIAFFVGGNIDSIAQDLQAISPGIIFFVIAFFGSALLMGLSAGLEGLFFMLWIFRMTENLRVVTKTKFSPWGAIVCMCIPYVGGILLYFILKNLIQRQEEYLTSNDVNFVPANMKFLNAMLAVILVSSAVSLAAPSSASWLLIVTDIILAFAYMVCLIKLVMSVTAQEKILFDFYNNQEFRRKVNEMLRERDMVSTEKV